MINTGVKFLIFMFVLLFIAILLKLNTEYSKNENIVAGII